MSAPGAGGETPLFSLCDSVKAIYAVGRQAEAALAVTNGIDTRGKLDPLLRRISQPPRARHVSTHKWPLGLCARCRILGAASWESGALKCPFGLAVGGNVA